MLTLESWRFPVLGEVSFIVRTLTNSLRHETRSYYYIVYYLRPMLQSISPNHNNMSRVVFKPGIYDSLLEFAVAHKPTQSPWLDGQYNLYLCCGNKLVSFILVKLFAQAC